MDSRELMKAAMRRQPTARIPTMPQICHDTPIHIHAEERGEDWRQGFRRCVEDPTAAYEYVIRLVRRVGCDGLRLFVTDEPRKVVGQGDDLVVLDPKTGGRIGHLDLYGGGAVRLDDPPPPIETLDDAQRRLAELAEIPDERLAILRDCRDRVPDLFVATAPGSITMGTYNELRGREQAMIDFFERPDFVQAVMEMQAETVIRRAEQLLPTGVDCFYIGDPSASSSLISPKHFERFCLPAYRKFCAHFKGRDVLVYIHICGNSNPILEMMADTGADVVEPLDPLGGVEVADARKRIGHKVALMGGLNTLTLARGTPEQVRDEAIHKCREGGPQGYILAAGDMVPPDTPLANLQAMVDVARHGLWRSDEPAGDE